ncbi:hypothetical protein OAK75_02910 [Bacteriovoracales bacterium]|nr:hypothetical protein [Bacteriovoracales bacterium]
MKKIVLGLFFIVTSFSTYAEVNSDRVIQLSYDVSDYLENNAHSMDQTELTRINSLLNRVLRGGLGNQFGAICTPDKNKLISRNGQEVFDYSSSTSCKKGLKQFSQYGAICAPNNNKLFSRNGQEVFDYSSFTSCKKGLKQLGQYGALCTPNKNKLISRNGQEVFDYSSSTSCKKGLKQLGQ